MARKFYRRMPKVVFKLFEQLNNGMFPREDKTMRINNLTDLKAWLSTEIKYENNEQISLKDIIATQYYAAKNLELGEEYGRENWKNVYERFVADADFRDVKYYLRSIKKHEPEEYQKNLEYISNNLPKIIINNLWRNTALGTFITLHVTSEKSAKRAEHRFIST